MTSRESPKENLKELRVRVIWRRLDRRWRRRLRQSTTPPRVKFLKKTSIFEFREELQLQALRQKRRFHRSPSRSLVQRSHQARCDVDPWCSGRCAPDHRRSQKLSQSEMRRHIQHARHSRSSLEDPVARPESKPSCRHVVNHTSRHAACKTHAAQFCGPLLSVPLSASRLLTESGARYAAGLYVRRQ